MEEQLYNIFMYILSFFKKTAPCIAYLTLGMYFYMNFKIKKINQILKQSGDNNKGINQSIQGSDNKQSAKIR